MTMARYKIAAVFVCMVAAMNARAEDIVVAEFRADRGLTLGGWASPAARDDDLAYPDDLYAEEIGSSQEKSFSLGEFTLSGVLDWGHRASYWAGERYSDEQYFSLGSRLRVGENSETLLYYGYGMDRPGAAADLYRGFGDAETARTGLAQTLYFADQKASVGVGYAYATSEREDMYDGRQGHEVNVSGDVRLGWGINAHLEAGYGLYSYSEYDGVGGELSSARTNMRAGISRSFSPSLRWGMH
ncbi:MAG TPA: hypothetical protein VK973_13025, partial [Arenicellales bacterium]|nr:hypothetical protein [Arenicellales bacterium]